MAGSHRQLAFVLWIYDREDTPRDWRACEHDLTEIPGARFCPICGASTEVVPYLAHVRESLQHAGFPFDRLAGGQEQILSWPSVIPDMVRLSRTFPEVLFCAEAHGASRGDVWAVFALGGKMQWAAGWVDYPPFDPDKLEEVPLDDEYEELEG